MTAALPKQEGAIAAPDCRHHGVAMQREADDFALFAFPREQKAPIPSEVLLNRAFVVSVWRCPLCSYSELYCDDTGSSERIEI